jgi:hypothetical protein
VRRPCFRPRERSNRTTLETRYLSASLLLATLLLSGCSLGLPGQWEYSCDRSGLVPDTDRCHVSLALEDTELAFMREADRWLLATAWMGPDFQMIQATIDIPGLRRTVRGEDGYCSGPVCWIELTQEQVTKLADRRFFRVELTRVFLRETGGMRRGTTGFHATTNGLAAALERL